MYTESALGFVDSWKDLLRRHRDEERGAEIDATEDGCLG